MNRAYLEKRKETREISSARKNKPIVNNETLLHTINLQLPQYDHPKISQKISKNLFDNFPTNYQLSPPKYRNRINTGSISARKKNNWTSTKNQAQVQKNQLFETLGEVAKNRKISHISASSLANDSQLKPNSSQVLIPTFSRDQFTLAKNDEILFPYQMKVFWKTQNKFVCLRNCKTSTFVNLAHPNIVKIYGKVSLNSKQTQTSPYKKKKQHNKEKMFIVLDADMLHPVKDLLSQFGALDESLVKAFLKKVIMALKQLHEAGSYFHSISTHKIFYSKKGKISISPLIQSPKTIISSLKFHMSKLAVGDSSQSFSISGLSTLKQIDFNQKYYERLIFYLAPQIFFSVRQNKKADTWAIGVLCLELLLGSISKIGNYHPYTINLQNQKKKSKMFKYSAEQLQIIERINFEWNPLIQSKLQPAGNVQLSKQAQKFIIHCLNIRQQQRSKIGDLLKHPFLKL